MNVKILIPLCLVIAVAAFFAGRQTGGPAEAPPAAMQETWYCSMHPEVHSNEPGLCPKCNMQLVRLKQDDAGPRTLVMSEAGKKLAAIRTAPVERRFINNEIRLQGKVAYDERRVAVISAWFAARIDRLFVDFTGDEGLLATPGAERVSDRKQ